MTLILGLGPCVVERVDSEEYELGLAYSEKPPADKEWTGTRQNSKGAERTYNKLREMLQNSIDIVSE